MPAQPTPASIVENIAAEMLKGSPSIAQLCNEYNLSRPTVRAIKEGKHPSLSAVTRRKLAKPQRAVAKVPRNGTVESLRPADVRELQKLLRGCIRQLDTGLRKFEKNTRNNACA